MVFVSDESIWRGRAQGGVYIYSAGSYLALVPRPGREKALEWGEVSGVIARVGRDRVQEEVMWKNEMFKGIRILCIRERKWSAMKEGSGKFIRRE